MQKDKRKKTHTVINNGVGFLLFSDSVYGDGLIRLNRKRDTAGGLIGPLYQQGGDAVFYFAAHRVAQIARAAFACVGAFGQHLRNLFIQIRRIPF